MHLSITPPLRGIALLTHADTDLAALELARARLPADFAHLSGISLHAVASREAMNHWLAQPFATHRMVVVRVLGRADDVPGLARLADDARENGYALLVTSGTGEPDPQFDRLSNVAPALLRDAAAYLQAGGADNLTQFLLSLSDRLFLTGYGYLEAQPLPEHGIYHPRLTQLGRPSSAADFVAQVKQTAGEMDRARVRPTVGILFYRAHWASGNTGFIDALVDALAMQEIVALPVYTASLRQLDERGYPLALGLFAAAGGIDVLINTTSFALGDVNNAGPTPAGWSIAVFEELDVPVLQAITSSMTQAQWSQSARGLNPLDTAMNVALPEFDGRIIGVPISFKQAPEGQAAASDAGNTSAAAVSYVPLDDRIRRTAGLAAKFAALRHRPIADKRIAFIFTNANAKASQIGNAVGLDAPASLMAILQAMQTHGYQVGPLPESSDTLIHMLIERGAYDEAHLTSEQLRNAVARVPAAQYEQWFADLPAEQQQRMNRQWGPPPGAAYVDDGHLMLAGLELGNAFVALQPPRGYGMDPDAIYHQPDLAPTHHYYALYRWLRDSWKADAIVHVGKHGTLEWLPGKGVGLSETCFPDSFLADMPLFYPFILNDPGEGSQAKRRAHAVVIDHLTPPLTTADTYGPLAQLVQLVDEYYQVEMLDPVKLPLVQQQIWDVIKQANLDTDLALLRAHEHQHEPVAKVKTAPPVSAYKAVPLRASALARGRPRKHEHHAHGEHGHDHDHDDHHAHHHHEDHHHGKHSREHDAHHDHAWDATLNEHGVPASIAGMEGVDIAHLIEDIDGYLCELGAAQIRDGLHILGQVPQHRTLTELLNALVRLPNLNVPGLPATLAEIFGLDWSVLQGDKGQRLNLAALDATDPAALVALQGFAQRSLHTHADLIETIDRLVLDLLAAVQASEFDPAQIDRCVDTVVQRPSSAALRTTLNFVCTSLAPNLARTGDEISNLLHALDGGYVPAGPSGAPTRGMAHVLPTGRNFYSVDPRAIPSMAAAHVGTQLAHEVLQRHLAETGRYPESVGISVWGTSAMRTHGDDIAEVLALLGVRPVWQAESRRVTGFEVIPLEQLGRPRIDVTVRISGFFRDAFPHLIALVDAAIQQVAELDEPVEQNFVRKHVLDELKQDLLARRPTHSATSDAAPDSALSGEAVADAADTNHAINTMSDNPAARRRALYRIFGAKPGSYGAGILPLIQEQNWQSQHDFADAYVAWGGYAYTGEDYGIDAHQAFRTRLAGIEIALHNQDNREHDIFDSDDYLQFHGGMIATIHSLSGRRPLRYFGDTHNPERAQVRDLKQETLRVFRARVVNPKWLASIRRHGYKGGLELTATVDYLFGYDATADVLDDWIYEQLAQTYALDPEMQAFLAASNPWALNAITERLLEAAQRQMWEHPDPVTLAALQQTLLDSETQLEARGETERGHSPAGGFAPFQTRRSSHQE